MWFITAFIWVVTAMCIWMFVCLGAWLLLVILRLVVYLLYLWFIHEKSH